MIDENELLRHLPNFADERQLEKDYLINLMLKIFSMTELSARALFKGGTAMSLFYGLDRFSEDLDFTYMYKEGETEKDALVVIDRGVGRILADYNSNYTVRKSKTGVLGRNADGSMRDVRNEFFIEGPLFSRTGRSHKIKLEVSLRRDVISAPKTAEKLISKYRDIGSMLLYVMGENEILSEKECALIERDKARDLYDMYFLLRYKGVKFDRGMFARKKDLRGEMLSLGTLRSRISKFDGKQWKEELSYLLKQLPEVSEVKKTILKDMDRKGKEAQA